MGGEERASEHFMKVNGCNYAEYRKALDEATADPIIPHILWVVNAQTTIYCGFCLFQGAVQSSIDYPAGVCQDLRRKFFYESKANEAVDFEDRVTETQIAEIVEDIASRHRTRMLVEQIQDLVEEHLMELRKYPLMKAYILYRYERALVRKANTTDDSILSLIKNDNKDVMLQTHFHKTRLCRVVKRVAESYVALLYILLFRLSLRNSRVSQTHLRLRRKQLP